MEFEKARNDVQQAFLDLGQRSKTAFNWADVRKASKNVLCWEAVCDRAEVALKRCEAAKKAHIKRWAAKKAHSSRRRHKGVS